MSNPKTHKKRGRIRNPSSLIIYSRFICLPVRSPRKTSGRLRGQAPIHGKFYRGHVRYACLTHTTPSVRFSSWDWFLFRGLLQSIMKIAISQSPSRPSFRPPISSSPRYIAVDVANKSNRMNPVECSKSATFVPSLSPFPVSHGGAESSYAGRVSIREGGQVESDGGTGRADDTVDGRSRYG